MKVWSKALRERERERGGGNRNNWIPKPDYVPRLGTLLEIYIYFKFEGSHGTFTLEVLKQKEKGQ